MERAKKKEDLASLAATFVATVKHLQQEAGVNDAELSRAINLDRGTLSRLLSGETTDPRLSSISAIAKFFAVPMSTLFGEENKGFVPVYEQHSLRAARKAATATRHDQLWIKVSNIDASRFAVKLAPKHRSEPLPPNATLVIGEYESLDSGDLVLVEADEQTYLIVKINNGETLTGFDIESTSKRHPIEVKEKMIVGKILEIVIGR
ncbi:MULTISPECIES: helix-turn-helix domain-containing protein [Burkholderia cepacia complex]|uniref:helix-turn-helix domain-containing protein n=1 Tax=Burkholderia cepacia complex TaxID=87882 RepID=UPI001CF457B6|nr:MULTISPECIES: helix-turn-helix transcriptional regulator [Burkholderia cepacia complex]MCA7888896.1 helix-turn-helix transcriptional regulator [Burkholderia contaminans]